MTRNATSSALKELALVSRPNAWNGQRNPIFYTTLAKVDIDPDALKFSPATPVAASPSLPTAAKAGVSDNGSPDSLTIAAAKAGLALYYGVGAEAVEIVIRG